ALACSARTSEEQRPSAVAYTRVSGRHALIYRNAVTSSEKFSLSKRAWLLYNAPRAAVAQLDRVLGYEPRGRGFDSCQPHQLLQDACLRTRCLGHFSFPNQIPLSPLQILAFTARFLLIPIAGRSTQACQGADGSP